MLIVFLGITIASIVVYLASTSRATSTVESFLVADRAVGLRTGAMIVSASWLQAPALLASGVFAYQGVYQFLAFLVPNVFALVLMSFLAPRIQDRLPRGYTIPECIGDVYGPNVRTLYAMVAFASLLLVVGYTMTALQQWIGGQLGVPAWQLSIVIGVVACAWILPYGSPTAVVSDVMKFAIATLGVCGIVIMWISGPVYSVSHTAFQGSMDPWSVAWFVGVPLAASLIGGPISNPDMAERVYVIRRECVRGAYLVASLLFCVGATAFGSLGFMAKAIGLGASGARPPALGVIEALVPSWALIVITASLVVLLVTALASQLSSASDLASIELFRRFSDKTTQSATIRNGRIGMIVAVSAGVLIASFNINLGVILQSMAVVRGESILPLVIALFFVRSANSTAMFWGMIVGAVVGIVLMFGLPLVAALTGMEMQLLVTHSRPLAACVAFLAPLAALLVWKVSAQAFNWR